MVPPARFAREEQTQRPEDRIRFDTRATIISHSWSMGFHHECRPSGIAIGGLLNARQFDVLAL